MRRPNRLWATIARWVVSVILFGLAVLYTGAEPCLAGGCGLMPMRPLTPMGCRDLMPVCVCDVRGQNCHWTWQCVP